ncbi:hypothetical protein BMS3Abin03_02151 [bacterium BMS3Abin03]|nr:hypothetical protein BMS3Abin03_02151 [bacterium BMS3Abin03]
MKNQTIIRFEIFLLASLFLSMQSVFAQGGKMMPKDGSTIQISKYSFDETVDILKGAIEEQNLKVIKEIDVQKMLRMAGKEVKGIKQLLYFNPNYGRRIYETNNKAGIQIPLKFIVMEKPDGKVVVRYFMPVETV